MRRLTSCLTACAAMLLSAPAFAQTPTPETEKILASVGVQGTNGYMTFTVAPTADCYASAVYFYVNTDSGKATLAAALSAYLSGKIVKKLQYTKQGNGQCLVDLVEF